MNGTLRAPRMGLLILALLLLTLVIAACGASGQASEGGATGSAATEGAGGMTETAVAPESADTAEMPSASSTITGTTAVTGTMNAGGEAGIAQIAVGENDEFGRFLVDGAGMALYLFANDTPGSSNCYDQCETNWPPLFGTSATVDAGELDQALVRTTTRRDGRMQITYNGWPLYYFAADQNPGEVKGQGVGDVWWLISPEGELVR
jgi:predicted lipoprotein with Yx(FWY)xxD motif